MAREAKTKAEALSVDRFIASIEPEKRRTEAQALAALFGRVTGWPAVMWGPTMVGYGRYHYIYDSGHEGDAFAAGFSPRKAEHVLYFAAGFEHLTLPLKKLGKHRLGKSCLYLRSLDGIDLDILEEMIKRGLADLASRWPISPR